MGGARQDVTGYYPGLTGPSNGDDAMTPFFRFFLLAYFVLGMLTLGLRFVLVQRRIGSNPAIRPDTETAEGLIANYFAWLALFCTVVVMTVSLLPQHIGYFVPIPFLDDVRLKYVGCGLQVVSLALMLLGQHQMRSSWRFGIHSDTRTELVTRGLFRLSRNPIYAATLGMLVGFFLVFPSAATLLILALSYMLTHIQIRLEEEYLARHHGQAFLDYKKRVRRLI
jgi:protein-S-isoprenylcysteine O-methyltransferase Ste14